MKTIAEQIAAAARELRLREGFYPKATAAGKMKPERAEHELEAMRSILETLKGLERGPSSELLEKTAAKLEQVAETLGKLSDDEVFEVVRLLRAVIIARAPVSAH